MLSLQQSKSHRSSCTPNILPCRVNHNGPVNASRRYWNPIKNGDGNSTAYFRGRKLNGRNVKVPKGYKGVVAVDTKKALPRKSEDVATEDDEEREAEEEVRIMEEHGNFEEFVVWGHECVVDGLENEYVKGLEEWIGFAETMHDYSMDASENIDKKAQ